MRLLFPSAFLVIWFGPELTISPISQLAFFYSAVWLPCAFYAAFKGDYVHPIWWILMPVTLLLRMGTGTINTFTVLFSFASPLRISINWLDVGIEIKFRFYSLVFSVKRLSRWVLITILSVVLFILPWPKTLLVKTAEAVAVVIGVGVFKLIFSCVTLFFVALICGAVYTLIIEKYLDQRRLSKWIKNAKEKISLEEFQTALDLFRTDGVTNDFLSEVRRKKKLSSSQESKNFLLEFASRAEMIGRKRSDESLGFQDEVPHHKTLTPENSTSITHWLDEYEKRNSSMLRIAMPEIADELYQLIEQVSETSLMEQSN